MRRGDPAGRGHPRQPDALTGRFAIVTAPDRITRGAAGRAPSVAGMTTSAHSPRGTASDSLLVQVDPDNILQVRNAYLTQQQRLTDAVLAARRDRTRILPGRDPISVDYADVFGQKVNTVVDRFRAHVDELREATNRLGEAAREYGFTEDEIEGSFRDFRSRTAGTPGPPRVVDR